MTVAAGLSPWRVVLSFFAACGLAFSGWTAYAHAAHPVAPATPRTHELKLARIELEAAADTLTQAHRLVGTYAETDLHVFKGLVLERAGENAYCVQLYGVDGGVYRLAGPRGRVERGRCPTT